MVDRDLSKGVCLVQESLREESGVTAAEGHEFSLESGVCTWVSAFWFYIGYSFKGGPCNSELFDYIHANGMTFIVKNSGYSLVCMEQETLESNP